MPVENILIYLNSEIQKRESDLATLKATRDVVTGLIAPQLDSIVGLQARVNELRDTKIIEEVTP